MSASNPYRKNSLLKVVLLGDGGVGKSCLMNRFIRNNFDNHTFHTVGVEFFKKDIEINGEGYTLQVGLTVFPNIYHIFVLFFCRPIYSSSQHFLTNGVKL